MAQTPIRPGQLQGVATAAQGALADSSLQPTDIASGTITPRADDIDFSGGVDGDVLTVQADGSLALEAAPGAGGGDAWSDPVDADIVPDADGTRDIGTNANRFAFIYGDIGIFTTLAGVAQVDGGASGITINDANSLPILDADTVGGSAVNYLRISNSLTGNVLPISAIGTDTNISINLVPKGTGEIQIAGQRALDETDLASPTFTGILTYTQSTAGVSALGNLGATETIDWSTATRFTGTLDSNVTITHSNEVSGRTITLYLVYDGSAQRTITWSGVDTWLDNNDGSAPVTPSGAGEVLVVTMDFVGTTCYASATGNYPVYA